MNPPINSGGEGASSLPGVVVLDACVLLNLHASGRVYEILEALPIRCLVASSVRREALWYLGQSDHDKALLERRDVLLDPLVAACGIEVIDLTVAEQVMFVELAEHLDDGEAASGALAIGKSAAVATDDLKAIRVFGRLRPPLRTVETGTLLRCWEERSGAKRSAVVAALLAIQRGARFSPRRDADGATWWRERVRELSSPQA